MLICHYFPGMSIEYVEQGPDGDGIPWDTWVFCCELIDIWYAKGM